MNLIERLQKKDSETKNIAALGIKHMKTPGQMKKFFREYVAYIRENGTSERARKNPELCAAVNITYFAARHSGECMEKWNNALKMHRIFTYY